MVGGMQPKTNTAIAFSLRWSFELAIACQYVARQYLVVNVSDVSGNGAHALDKNQENFKTTGMIFQMMGGVGSKRVTAKLQSIVYTERQSVQLEDWKQQQILSASFSADIFGLLCLPRLGNIVPLLSSDLINND